MEFYPEAMQNRFTVYRPKDRGDAIWMHPGEPVFDLENNSGPLRSESVEGLDQLRHILRTPHKRKGHQVPVLRGEVEVLMVLFGQCRNAQPRIGKVYAFLRAQFGGAVDSMGNFDFESLAILIATDRANYTSDLAIIKEDALAEAGSGGSAP